jgi:small-conductance mechanosensitive channel
MSSLEFTPGAFFQAFLVFIFTLFILTVLKVGVKRNNKLDRGRKHSIFTLISYVVWITAISLILSGFGFNFKLVLAGSAALLVGVGLGLQNIFNDIVSGIFILFEGTIKVGDIIEVDGLVCEVKKIQLRVSKVKTREDIIIFVPNSQLVANKVINWSQDEVNTRFTVKIPLPYNCDLEDAKQIILASTYGIKDVSFSREPMVRILDFSERGIETELHFWSQESFRVEQTKSNIREAIWYNLAKHNIKIPYPNRELWSTNRGNS